MLKLGSAQGVALGGSSVQDIPIAEYAPRKVKQSITGSGAASKEQVAAMVARTLKIPVSDLPKGIGCDRRAGRGVVPPFPIVFASHAGRIQRMESIHCGPRKPGSFLTFSPGFRNLFTEHPYQDLKFCFNSLFVFHSTGKAVHLGGLLCV
jgi:hypothetical protein